MFFRGTVYPRPSLILLPRLSPSPLLGLPWIHEHAQEPGSPMPVWAPFYLEAREVLLVEQSSTVVDKNVMPLHRV